VREARERRAMMPSLDGLRAEIETEMRQRAAKGLTNEVYSADVYTAPGPAGRTWIACFVFADGGEWDAMFSTHEIWQDTRASLVELTEKFYTPGYGVH
jgi:hypothetical protein